MYCRNCGKEVRDDDTFCFNCGTQLGNSRVSEMTVPRSETTPPVTEQPNPKKIRFPQKQPADSAQKSGKTKSTVVNILSWILLIGFLYFLLGGPAQRLATRLDEERHEKNSGIEHYDEPEEVSIQTVEQTIASYEGFELVLHSIHRSNHYDSTSLIFSVVNISSRNYRL